jgi:autotransporter-associated beta strand protein
MKPTYRSFRPLFPQIIAASFGAALMTGGAFAGNSNWIGNTDANLATAGNWDVAPVSGDTWIFGAAGTAGVTLTNNLTTPSTFEVAGFNFGATAGAYVIDSAHSATFTLTGNIVTTSANDHNIGSNIVVSGTRQVNLNGSKNILLSGNLSGSGSLTQTAGGTGAKSIAFSGDNSGFTGTFTQNNDGNNRTAFNAAAAGSSTAAWVLNRNVNGGTALNFPSGSTIHFGALSGGGFIRANTTGTITVSVGALNTSTTLDGIFQQSNTNTDLALTKVGTGTFTLKGTNTHEGTTTVNGGTLDVTTGSITNSAVTVNSTGTFKLSASKTIAGLTVNAGGTAQFAGSETISNGAALTGANGILDLVNTTVDTITVSGAAGLTLGGATGTDTAVLKLDVGATADKLAVANGLAVDAGGASIQINNLGISAGQNYPLITFSSGSGAGYTTGTGTTVGALTLANPSLSFGVSGELEVTATGVNLVTTGATPPAAAYWSGSIGSAWNSTSGSNANFTTTAAGSTFLNVLPGGNTQVFFSNNSATNLTNTLGENFSILGLTYRGSSGAVSTSGASTLNIGTGGIEVESGNGGATLAVTNLTLGGDQTWTNNSANPLTVSATTVSGVSNWLTLQGTGSIHLGGTSLSVLGIDLLTNLDLKGTSITAGFGNSTGNITNTGAVNASIAATIGSDADLSGVISDSGSGAEITLNKSGAAALTLSGANTYSGGSNVANGTLKAGNNSAFGTGAVNITANTGTLDLNGKTIANEINNAGATGCVITNSSATSATVSSGMNAAGAAGYVISDFTFNGTGDIRWDGALNRTAFTGTLTKSGTNTLILNNDNGTSVIAGLNLVINDGTVVLGKTVTSFTNLTLSSGTLKMDPNYQVGATFGIWQGSFGNEIVMNGGVWDLNDTGGINNRIKRVSGTGGTITNSGIGDSLLVLAARDVGVVPTVTWGGNIQDGGSGGKVAVTIQDGGSIGQVMIFSGTHTYSGATNILRNTMRAGAAGVFSANSEFILSNNTESTLDLNGFNNTIGALSGANAASKVLLGAGTLTVGGLGYSGTFNGIISGTGGITKVGTGTFTLIGANTYTGDTTVNAGILGVDGDAIPDTNKLIINSGGAVEVTGNEIVANLEIEGSPMADGTYGATGSGAANIDDTHFAGTGILTVGAGYSSWAATNAGGQTADLDFDLDGVSNGVEYFVNAATGFTANPGIVSGSVTWTNGGNIPSSAYGTQFVVQTSSNLTTWTPVDGSDANLSNTTGSVSYTLPTGAGKLFVRLVVTPN